MTKKTKTYLLITVVIIIWGLLIYKVVDGLTSSDDVVETSTLKAERLDLNLKPERDTATLMANYRDPFLGSVQKRTQSKRPRPSTPKIEEPDEPVPPIAYSGHMTDPKTGKRVFFVDINGQQHMLKSGEAYNDLRLVSGDSEQVVLLFGSQKLTIPITN